MKVFVSRMALCAAGMLLAQPIFAESNSSSDASTSAQPSGTLISEVPCVLTNSGTYYLATNLAGTGGIIVSAGNVTIDLKGFSLTGVQATNSGIFALYNVTNLVVRDGTISGWNGHGIYEETVKGCQAINLEVSSNNFSGLDLGDECKVTSCKVHDNGITGILTGNKAVIKDTVTQKNLGDGIRTGENSQVSGCSSFDNHGGGIVVGGKSVVQDCISARNTQSGIFVNQPGCNIVSNNCFSNNIAQFLTSAGIYIFDSNNRIESNRLADNGYAGISVTSGYTNNVIVKNSVTGSGKHNYLVPPGNQLGPIVASTSSPADSSSNISD